MKLLVNIVTTLNRLGHRWTGIGRPQLQEPFGFFKDGSLAAEFAAAMPEKADPELAIRALIAYGDALCTAAWAAMPKDFHIATGPRPSEYLEVLDEGKGVAFTSIGKRLAVRVTAKEAVIRIRRPEGTAFLVKKAHDSNAPIVQYNGLLIAGRHLRMLGDILSSLSGRHIRLLGRFPDLEEDYGPERILSMWELTQMGRALGIEVVA